MAHFQGVQVELENVDQEALAAPGHAENGVDLLPVLAIDRSAVFDSPRVAVEHFPKLRQDVDGFLVHQVRPPGGVLRAAHGIDLGHYDGPEFLRVVQRRQPESVLGEVVAAHFRYLCAAHVVRGDAPVVGRVDAAAAAARLFHGVFAAPDIENGRLPEGNDLRFTRCM